MRRRSDPLRRPVESSTARTCPHETHAVGDVASGGMRWGMSCGQWMPHGALGGPTRMPLVEPIDLLRELYHSAGVTDLLSD